MTELSPRLTLRTVLCDFRDFLRRPAVLDPQGWSAGGGKHWAVLTALLIVGLIGVLLPFLGAWQKLFSLPSPTAFDNFDKRWLVPVTVIFAPIAEELLFRGWQRGSASSLWLMLCAILAGVTVGVMTDASQALIAAGVLLALLIAGIAGWVLLRKRPAPMPWFARIFPWIFYAVAAGFALFHLSNYPRFSLLMVPLVLPQLWAALVLGYLRQRLGLAQAILTHVAANACSIGLALASGSIGS
ncbi:CPBP family glutamic-type intramembrane protease [Novosphingobium sp.]|uniref:CPBP family glutamic-type intramembrane protease n=1 Tax=Novosphingobium sp. TaxID=1874826 RepID=UPI0025E30794|nr:CPBP family glutamic-type intramembrane protease [Novosphingobium sp.]